MRRMILLCAAGALLAASLAVAQEKNDGNRLAYLNEPCNPYCVSRQSARLVTPQWVGEEGVEAAIVLSIDDLKDTKKYETFLRPIATRLKQIDGRAPVTLFATKIDPADEQIPQWLAEGITIEAHTADHPCPLLQGGDLAKAKDTYDRCVDQLCGVPNLKPTAFRMPCCDSLNTVSPRFFERVFFQKTPKGNRLKLDSSVFNVFTADDPNLPRELVVDADGRARFRRYLPADREFANYVEDYPYPYPVGNLCWELPIATPSDWQAFHLNGPASQRSVDDLKYALDATVIKQGVFVLCFHPHGWIRNDQVVDLIDHAVKKHGKKVAFLTCAEVLRRIDKRTLGRTDWDRPAPPATPKPPAFLPGGLDRLDRDTMQRALRYVDIDSDGRLDVIFSSPERYALYLNVAENQWRKIVDAQRGTRPAAREIPPFVRADGSHNGVWFAHGRLWIQNEDTGKALPLHCDWRRFTDLLTLDLESPGVRSN